MYKRQAQIWFKGYNLLTAKPTIYAANVAEDDLADDGASNPHVAKVREMAAEEGAKAFVICAQAVYKRQRLYPSARAICRLRSSTIWQD